MRRGNGPQRGFTLIELLVVLAIIALLAALVGPQLFGRLKPAKQVATRAQIEGFCAALDSYYLDMGRFPSSAEGLNALWEAPTGVTKWRGPYLRKEVPLDPWEHAYVYRAPALHGPYEIVSLGADGKEGGAEEDADVVSWASKK